MKARVTEDGVVIPKAWLEGVEAVEIRRQEDGILVVPLRADPILQLGTQPLEDDATDASENHDAYLYP